MPIGTAAPGFVPDPEQPGQVKRDETGAPVISYPFVPSVAVIDTYSRFPDGNTGRPAGSRLVVSRPVPGNFDIFYQAWDYLATEHKAQIDGDAYREGLPSTIFITDDRVLVPPYRPSRTAAYVELDDQPGGKLDIVMQLNPDPDNPYARTVDVRAPVFDRNGVRRHVHPGEVVAGTIELGVFPDSFDGTQYRLSGPQDDEARNHVSHNQIVASGIMRAVTAKSVPTSGGGFVSRRMSYGYGEDADALAYDANALTGTDGDVVVEMDRHRLPRAEGR
jgi:hypothetical protein